MANLLPKSVVAEIFRLRDLGWSKRGIARATNCTLNTVMKRLKAGVITGKDSEKRVNRAGYARPSVPDSGKSRLRLANDVRKKIAATLRANPHLSRNDLLLPFRKEGFGFQQLSHILRQAIINPSFGLNTDGKLFLPHLVPVHYVYPSRWIHREREKSYERKPIPHENETDITYLSRLPHIKCFDAPAYEDGTLIHERVPSTGMTPLEALMWKEEQADMDDLSYRRVQMRRYQERSSGLVSIADALDTAMDFD